LSQVHFDLQGGLVVEQHVLLDLLLLVGHLVDIVPIPVDLLHLACRFLSLQFLQQLTLLLQQLKLLKASLFILLVHFVDEVVLVEVVLILLCELSCDFFNVLRAHFCFELLKLLFVVF
jgi:hypothetical protein